MRIITYADGCARFGIRPPTRSTWMTILRDTLMLAVIRGQRERLGRGPRHATIEVEATHSHRAGVLRPRPRPDLPHDGVMRHFTQYGASSKSNVRLLFEASIFARAKSHPFLVFPTDFAFPAICHASGIAPPNPEQA